MFICPIQGSNEDDNIQRSTHDDTPDDNETDKHGEHEEGGGENQNEGNDERQSEMNDGEHRVGEHKGVTHRPVHCEERNTRCIDVMPIYTRCALGPSTRQGA